MDWIDKVEDVMVVLCTVPNEEVGVNLANCLVSEGLAACVNLLPAI
ncbi:MAG: divalent-cation tolerance protein CutA, partial [Sorangium cellulosum]